MLKKTKQTLEHAVFDLKVTPGAQAAIFENGRILTCCVGTLSNDKDSPLVANETLYDLASLTKPIATASSINLLMEKGKIGLEDTLGRHLVQARATEYESCTIEQMLSHTAGFPDWLPLYKSVPITLEAKKQAMEPMAAAVLTSTPVGSPGNQELYSDLDFFLLGRIVEKLQNLPFSEFASKAILQPLGMDSTSFRTVGVSDAQVIAPTGKCPIRGRVLVGEVNDENTWACGGASGQAGLFGNALDLIKFSLEILDALEDEGMIFSQELLEIFTQRPFPELEGSFALGWDTVSKIGTLTGKNFGPNAIGHHGFTGTSLWIDPDAKVAMALLTNRVHLSRDKTAINNVRPMFFDAAWEDIGGK